MKVVLDTNVLVSGLLSAEGTCSRILDLMIDGMLQPCYDGRIYAEYEAVLRRPELGPDAADVEEVLGFIRVFGEPVVAPPLQASLPDPHDLPFLEVAKASEAVLVTGNKRHFPKKASRAVPVVSPKELLDLIRLFTAED